MYIDSHAHLGDEVLFAQHKEVLERAFSVGIDAVVNICTNSKTLKRGMELHHSIQPKILLAAATTPHDVESEGESFFSEVEEAALQKKLAAIGETGLDYHYEYSPRQLQKKFLIQYFQLAIKMNLPLIFHCRDAFEDLFLLADTEYKRPTALLHCFTGALEEARQVLDRGWSISFSGIITFKKSEALREVVRYVPMDRMFIETDAPFLAPQSKRGLLNEPSFVVETAKVISEIKNISIESVAESTAKNARAFFAF